MLLAVVSALSICAGPSPTSSPTPLKAIVHITVSPLCSTLRHNIAQSIVGLRANDGLIQQSGALMAKIRSDADTEPRNDSPNGGAGVASEMDDVQLGNLVMRLSQNLERIEALLADPRAFPARTASDDERALAYAKERLESVAAEQRKALDILSGTANSNESTDLASQCDPVDCPEGGPTPVRISQYETLASQVLEEQKTEGLVAPAVVAIIDICRKKN